MLCTLQRGVEQLQADCTCACRGIGQPGELGWSQQVNITGSMQQFAEELKHRTEENHVFRSSRMNKEEPELKYTNISSQKETQLLIS